MALQSRDLKSDAELILFALDAFLVKNDISLNGQPWPKGLGSPADNRLTQSSWSWLNYLLGSGIALLKLAREGLPVRQFLDSIIDNIPSDTSTARGIATTRRVLREAKWTHLLNLDCGTFAELLEKVRSKMGDLQEQGKLERERTREYVKQLKAELKEAKNLARDDDEGTAEVRESVCVSWKDQKYYFGYLQAQLLAILSGGDEYSLSPGEPHNEGEVIEYVWNAPYFLDEIKRYKNTLHQLQNATKKALKGREIPLTIRRPSHGVLQLVPT